MKKFFITIMAVMTLAAGFSGISGTTVAQAKKMVWIAPTSGTKYHFSKNAKHFQHKNSAIRVSLKWAKSHGYTLGH